MGIMEETSEDSQFVVDEVSTIIKEAVENTIGGNAYQQNKVNQWTSTVVETCLASLTKLQKPFKYIVTCTIMQKTGAGLHTSSSCYWDNNTDGSCTVRWENKTIILDFSINYDSPLSFHGVTPGAHFQKLTTAAL